MSHVLPSGRVVALNDAPADPSRDYVLYWQTAARRTRWNFALEYAVDRSRAFDRPLVVLEALRAGYRWANDRLHRFALDAMRDDARAYAASGVTHVPYVEPEPGAGRGLLERLASRACLVVTDDFPEFFLPRMRAAAADTLARVGTRLEAVDGNGLLPMRTAGRAWPTAPHFRRVLQRELLDHLGWFPAPEPLEMARALPRLTADAARRLDAVRMHWPSPALALIGDDTGEAARALARLPIDHGVSPTSARGGEREGGRVLRAFVDTRLGDYGARRNEVDDPANSRLSPYLHWGCISVHEVFALVAESEAWSPLRLAPKPNGKREGWWGMGASAERFLDEVITWRELSYNTAHWMPDHDQWCSLPAWAHATLAKHGSDARPALFTRDELETGRTYDRLWNATQGQLIGDGRIHNYLRMLWGKKVVEWTRDPEEAFDHLMHLNNRWALDGRDPNSTSGIAWVFGRYDHPWPERPVIGTLRPMSSAATARKIRVDKYVARWAP